MSDFKAALPQVIKWSTGENKYDQTGKSPISISLFVPVESAFAFAQYVLNMADDETRHKTGKIWDYSSNCEIEVQGFYINGKSCALCALTLLATWHSCTHKWKRRINTLS